MTVSLVRLDPTTPTDEERQLSAESSRRLAPLVKGGDGIRVHVVEGDGAGEFLDLPGPAVRLLSEILAEMARGHAVALVSADSELTIQEAADYLNVSRPYLVGLLERGEIPSREDGERHRVVLRDLIAYKNRTDAAREEALDELARVSQELGLY
ncbi:MAG TPA: helix-turn-helix domain-containing protein [Isosphaeraceae bacterium]|nr:helix-turn-helix domain-containing protein [Isosphaeraceae bacterium]